MCMGAPHASVMKSTPPNDESRCRLLCDGGHTTSVRKRDGCGPEHRRRDVRFHRAGGDWFWPAATGLTPRRQFTDRCASSTPILSVARIVDCGFNAARLQPAVRGMELAASRGGSHVTVPRRTGSLAGVGSPAGGDARDRVHAIVLVG